MNANYVFKNVVVSATSLNDGSPRGGPLTLAVSVLPPELYPFRFEFVVNLRTFLISTIAKEILNMYCRNGGII